MKVCVCSNCPTTQESGVPLFAFPSDPVRRAEWQNSLGIQNIPKSAFVCIAHFSSDQLNQLGNRLRPGAIPRAQPYGSNESSQTSTSASQHLPAQLDDQPGPSHGQPAIEVHTQESSGSALLSQPFSTAGDFEDFEETEESDYDSRSPKRQKFELDQDKENLLPRDGSRVFLINEAQLRSLLGHCIRCGGLVDDQNVSIFGMGVDIRVESYCSNCSIQKWHSFPTDDDTKLHHGNGLMAAATLVTGNRFENINAFAQTMNLQTLSSSTYHRFVGKYAYPAIDVFYLEQHNELLREIQTEQANEGTLLKLAMDGRYSRPGYTATFGVVSAFDLDREKILDAHVLKRNDEEISSSGHMEVVGVQRLLEAFTRPCGNDTSDASNIAFRVGAVATDDSKTLIKMMKTDFPNIVHSGDPWHLLKNIRKRLEAVAKRAPCRELGYWIKSIDNFLWTCMIQCNGDGDLLVEQWRSMAYHIIGKHDWTDDASFSKYQKCAHSLDVPSKSQFLLPGTAAHEALKAILDDEDLQFRIRRCRYFLQTSKLESFHALMLRYVAKRIHFGDQAFRARVKLAVMDWNTNSGRGYRLDSSGNVMVRYVFPPSAKEWRGKFRTPAQDFEWRRELVKKIWAMATAKWKSGERPDLRPAILERPLVSQFDAPDRRALFDSLKRRKL